MTRRRRTTSRRGRPGADVFVMGNGVDSLLDPLDGEEHFENVFLARAAWPAYRTATWRIWLEERRPWHTHPPGGAVAYDGIGDHTSRIHLEAPLEAWREAVAADLVSVARFRADRPEEARDISDALDAYCAALHVALARAEAQEHGP